MLRFVRPRMLIPLISTFADVTGSAVDLSDKLLSAKQREKSGSLAQDRFDFQACWGITHLLDLHESTTDYAVAFEFHDDILVIDHTAGPTKVRFYQVKTKDAGLWTMYEISRRTKGKAGLKPSIAGKMFSNKERFPDETEHLGFVSNKPADFISKKYPCAFKETDKATYALFLSDLKNEFPGVVSDADGDLFHYHQTDFSLEKYQTFLVGRVADFIKNTCGDLQSGHDGFRLALVDRCRDRSKHMKDVSSFAELLKAKFVRRADLDEWVENLKVANTQRPSWDAVQSLLTKSKPLRLRDLKRQWDRYDTDRFKVSDVALHHLRTAIRQEIVAFGTINPDAVMEEIMEGVLLTVGKVAEHVAPQMPKDYVRAGILYEFMSS